MPLRQRIDLHQIKAPGGTSDGSWMHMLSVSGGETANSLVSRTDWDSVFTTVRDNSGTWDETPDIDNLAGTSGLWNDTRTTVGANSAIWALSGTETDITDLANASGSWNSVYTTVGVNSASWDESAELDALRNDIGPSSGGWNSVFNTVGSVSADWQDARTTLGMSSGNWDDARTTVASNSASWEESADITALRNDVGASSGNWNSVFDTVGANSGIWALSGSETSLGDIPSTSGNWNSVYDTVEANSGNWDGGGTRTASFFIDAGSMISNTTSGATAGASETTTNKVMVDTYSFTQNGNQSVQARVVMPNDWDKGTVQVRYYWGADAGSGNCIFSTKSMAVPSGNALDTAWGSSISTTTAFISAGCMQFSEISSAITIGSILTIYDPVWFKITREEDTCNANIYLYGVDIFYTSSVT